jgi:hypothetical protein
VIISDLTFTEKLKRPVSPGPSSYFIETGTLNKRLSNFKENQRAVFGISKRNTLSFTNGKADLSKSNIGPGSYNVALSDFN